LKVSWNKCLAVVSNPDSSVINQLGGVSMRSIFVAAVIAVSSIATFAQATPKQINGGVLNGKAVSLPKPEYPESARSAGLEGIVRVAVEIDEAGNVVSATALDEPQKSRNSSSEEIELPAADPILRDAGEKAAWGARFSPTLLSGNPVRVKGVIVYNFSKTGVPISDVPANANGLNTRAISMPKPAYPPAAAAVRAGGTVSVRLTVDEDGNVSSAEAISGHPLLRDSAVTAAKGARFAATIKDGKAVSVTGVVTYNFVPPDPPKEQ
jgi:TonB family protein